MTREVRTPQYKIEAISFKVVDESGPDSIWPFNPSDEPFWVFTTEVNGEQHTSRSKVYQNADSGDSFSFYGEDWHWIDVWGSKIQVPTFLCTVENCETGVDGPIALSVQLFEDDAGDPEHVKNVVEKALNGVELGAKIFGGDVEIPDEVGQYLVDLFGNDLMGSKTLQWSQQDLAQKLPSIGSSFTETYRLGQRGGDLPGFLDNPPDYDLTIQLTRLPDQITRQQAVAIPLGPITNEGPITRIK